MTDSAAMLRLSGLSKSLGGTSVIADLSLAVGAGELVSILGPSGCGKTTTLRIVAGFVHADGGELFLAGQRLNDVPSHRRGTAMVFQNYALFPHLTVGENVAFGPRMHKVPADALDERVREALELVQLSGLARRYPRELSGGQQQRVALARALAVRPQLLLLDEPLSNLDAKLRKELRAELQRIQRHSGLTTLFVTHDIEEALSISDRVAVMNKGRIEQYATPVEIYTRPRTRFVADFVGHPNVLAGRPTAASGDRASVRCGDCTIRVPRPEATSPTGEFVLPMHSVSLARKPVDADNCLPATIVSKHYMGPTVHVRVDVCGHLLSVETRATPEVIALEAGASVFAAWSSDDMIPLAAEN